MGIMANSTTARGIKRSADESILDEDNSIEINDNFTDINNATDASAANCQDDEMVIEDALEAWVEIGELSRDITRNVVTKAVVRLRKVRRLLDDDASNDDSINQSSGDNAAHDTPAAATSASNMTTGSSSSFGSGNIMKKTAFNDITQHAKRMKRGILSFYCQHENLRRELEDFLEVIRCAEDDEDRAVSSAEATFE